MRVDQLLPSFGDHDAIGNEARMLRAWLRKQGWQSDIFTELGHREGDTLHASQYRAYDAATHILIHHFSIGSGLVYGLSSYKATQVLRYHNITPPHYLSMPSLAEAFYRCREGYWQLPLVQKSAHVFWPTSAYTAQGLGASTMGPTCIVPVLRDYARLTKMAPKQAPSEDDTLTLLFVGRALPHKGCHDIFFYLAEYRRHYPRTKIRLVCLGSGDEAYQHVHLPQVAQSLGLSMQIQTPEARWTSDVVSVVGASDRHLAECYRRADIFVSFSEHEGFCVPLVEAMHFGLPIVIHKAAAMPEVANGACVALDKTQPAQSFELFARVINDPLHRADLAERSAQRAGAFAWPVLEQDLREAFTLARSVHAARSLPTNLQGTSAHSVSDVSR